jgi:hypothetical protein
MSLSSVGCTRCGSNELTEVDGFLKCVYCQSRYEVGSKQVSLPATSIGLADDVKTLLKKCEDEPANRQRYIRMILNIDPSNKEVQRFQEMGVQRRKSWKSATREQIEKLGSTMAGASSTSDGVVGLSSTAVSSKSWTVALVLSLLFGWLGVDRFYLGQVGLGVAKFLTAGGFGVWWVIDCVLIALRRAKDSDGRILR